MGGLTEGMRLGPKFESVWKVTKYSLEEASDLVKEVAFTNLMNGRAVLALG